MTNDKANAVDAMGHLLQRHVEVSKKLDEVTKIGSFAPGAIQAHQNELRGLEKAMAEIAPYAR